MSDERNSINNNAQTRGGRSMEKKIKALNEIKLNKNTSKNHQSFQLKKLAQKEFQSSRKLLNEV